MNKVNKKKYICIVKIFDKINENKLLSEALSKPVVEC